MKRICIFLSLLVFFQFGSLLFSQNDAEKKYNFHGPHEIVAPAGKYVFHSVNEWTVHTKYASRYRISAYMTKNNLTFKKSNTIMLFSYFNAGNVDLEKFINDDKRKFFQKYPGIVIRNLNLNNYDYSYYKKLNYPVVDTGKKYYVVLYDYTNSTVKHQDLIEILIFFKLNEDDDKIAILQLSSRDRDAFNHVDALKMIFMTFDKIDTGNDKEEFF